MNVEPNSRTGGAARAFPKTRETLVDALRSHDRVERDRAADLLVSLYWKPVYKYARLRWSKSNEEARELTQSFFAEGLDNDLFADFDPSRAMFRTWVRLLFDRLVLNEEKSLRRGGRLVSADFDEAEREIAREPAPAHPEELFHREWVRSFFSAAVAVLRDDLRNSGQGLAFELFEACDLAREQPSDRDLAQRFGIPETAAASHLAEARRRFHSIVLERLRLITATEAELRNETRALLGVDA